MIAYRFGYDIGSDLHHGLTIAWNKRVIGFHWNWPYFLWYNRLWAMNEQGYIPGMPVYRAKEKKWRIRAFVWPVSLKIGNWQTSRWIYLGTK